MGENTLRRPVIALALAAALLPAAASAGADLYSVEVTDGSSLVQLQEAGLRVRHVGDRTALVESDGRQRPAILEDAGAERLGAVMPGERLYACYPISGVQTMSDLGRVVWVEPDGATVLAVGEGALHRLRSSCFHVHELPPDVDTSEWFDDSPPPLIAQREGLPGLSARGVVEDVISSVSADSLMAHVERLTMYPGGDLRSRYTMRDECLSEAKPYIMDRLEAYLPPAATVDTQRFSVLGYSCNEPSVVVEYPADNIVGTLPGTGRLNGYYIICAHYDATASHSFGGDSMWWCDNPAPGADDNATGVAVVLESARALSGLTFPFDIRFILFTGEELGLLGSDAYADSVAAEGDTIYAVLNVDMVAYKPESGLPDTCHIVTNRGTTWLADWMLDTASLYPSYFDDFDMVRIDKALAYSDHASFWFQGYDGLVAIEHWSPRERNPYYHTLQDTFGSVVSSQLARVGRVIAGSVARLADTDGTFNLAVFPEDIKASPDEPETGDAVQLTVKVHAFGPDEDVDMTLTVWDGEPGEGELLLESAESGVMGGGEVASYTFYWLPDGSNLGENHITARIETDGVEELSYSDNTAVLDIRVNDKEDLFVMEHFVYPNPAGSAGDLRFRYELSREAGAAEIVVFDITGQELGTFSLGRGSGDPPPEAGLSAGWNTVGWDEFAAAADKLASGAYIYKLRLYERGGIEPVGEQTGRFAIVR